MRIIYNYFSVQLLKTTFVVASVLVLILVGGRFLRYLEHAAEGRLLGEAIFIIMACRLPEFLQMILPLSLFIGVLLCCGRLYLSNEMSVLAAAGVSRTQIIGILLPPTLGMSLTVAFLSLYLAPLGTEKFNELIFEQRNQSEFETLTPGRFHVDVGKNTVTYAQHLSKERDQMQKIFVAQMGVGNEPALVALVAESGQKRVDSETQVPYLELATGHRYELSPGQGAARVTQYQAYKLKLADQSLPPNIAGVTGTPTAKLWGSTDSLSQAQLQWRLSLPLLVPIVVLIAIPLSRVNTRQGRFSKIIPAVMLYLGYLGLLIDAKSKIEKQVLDPNFGLWWVHLLFFAISMILHAYPRIIWRWRMYQGAKVSACA